MARIARKISQLNIYTIVLRGRTEIFKGFKRKQMFFDTLLKYKELVKMYAYAVTNKDAYLVVEVPDGNIGGYVKKISISFARKYNTNIINFGKLFNDRYLSEALNTEAEVLNAIKNVNLIVKNTTVKNVVSSYSDYFSDALIDNSYVINNLQVDFGEYHKDKVAIATGNTIISHKYSDAEVANYIYDKYHIKATDINRLSKEKKENILTEIIKVTSASARQIYRITSVPLRFVWNLGKKIKTKGKQND